MAITEDHKQNNGQIRSEISKLILRPNLADSKIPENGNDRQNITSNDFAFL